MSNARMIWTGSGIARWDGAFQYCDHYHLERHEVGRKVTWVVLRGDEVVGEFPKKFEASEAALDDYWLVVRDERSTYEAEGRRKSFESRSARHGAPFEVIERESGVHRSLELRVDFDASVMPHEAWVASVYEPEFQETYGEIGVFRFRGSFATEQLAEMAAQKYAANAVVEGRRRKAEWEARYPALVSA